MIELKDLEINAAFYEMFERTFGDDFFTILSSLRSNPYFDELRKKKPEELSAEEAEALLQDNLRMSQIMRSQTSRITYIAYKLHKKDYKTSYDDFIAFLATCDATAFMDPDFIAGVWGMKEEDKIVPKSVKNVYRAVKQPAQ